METVYYRQMFPMLNMSFVSSLPVRDKKSYKNLRATAAKNQKMWDHEGSRNIKKQYFLEDNLEWIVNPKFQLSSIIGCRDIANSKTHKIQTKNLQTRI